MRKVFLILLSIVCLSGMSIQSATISPGYKTSIKKKKHDHFDKNSSFYKEREKDIEYRLDILKVKYDRDKDRLKNSDLNKYDKKIREKELKYNYEKEKARLKEKAKKESFYTN